MWYVTRDCILIWQGKSFQHFWDAASAHSCPYRPCHLCSRQTGLDPPLSPQQLPVSGVLGPDLPPQIQAASAKSGEQEVEEDGLVVSE